MNRIAPALHTPALLAAHLPLLQIRKLPEVMHRIQLADLHEPGADALHDFTPGPQPAAPVRLPFEQVARVQRVGAQLEYTAQLARGGCGPEGKFLHQRHTFAGYEGFELGIKRREVGMVGDGMEGVMVAMIALVFPNMDFSN
jgi:hypothetical protein